MKFMLRLFNNKKGGKDMKKHLSILLCCIMILGSLFSCNSQDEPDASTSYQENFVIENVKYFKGDYDSPIGSVLGWPIYSNGNVMDCFTDSDEGLWHYLQGMRMPDVYFLVGVTGGNQFEDFESDEADKAVKQYEENVEFTKAQLAKCGFIEIEDHPMVVGSEVINDMYACSGNEEVNAVREKYVAMMFPDIDFEKNELSSKYLFYFHFMSVGYISVRGLRELAQITDVDEEIKITWFPAPDDQERWLTIIPKEGELY